MTASTPASNNQDVVDILTADHEAMLTLIDDIKTSPNEELRRDRADTVIAEVVRHLVAEEQHVDPVITEYLPDGAEEVEHDKDEHHELVDVMKRLEDLNANDPAFMKLVYEFESQLRRHAHHEEDDQFPKLREHIPADTLRELGIKVEWAKNMAPTRPHPHAPQSELFHKIVGPGMGMVDRLRDRLTERTTE